MADQQLQLSHDQMRQLKTEIKEEIRTELYAELGKSTIKWISFLLGLAATSVISYLIGKGKL